jgi:hypothetical protein
LFDLDQVIFPGILQDINARAIEDAPSCVTTEHFIRRIALWQAKKPEKRSRCAGATRSRRLVPFEELDQWLDDLFSRPPLAKPL